MKSPGVLCMWLLFAWAQSASAIDVVESQTLWGFDGQVQVGRFVPLTVEIDNPSPDPIEVTLTLRKELHQGGGGRVDATLVERHVYLAPYKRRNVQFYPYISEHVTWSISWGRGLGKSKELPSPRFTDEPARVVLTRGNNVARQSTGLKQMPEERFPPIVTATETLATVVLDHVPRWDEEARRQAFLEWLHLGGKLHLFQDETQQFPAFTGSLGVLNSPLQVQPIGAGTVYRHPRTLGKLEPDFVRETILEQTAQSEPIPLPGPAGAQFPDAPLEDSSPGTPAYPAPTPSATFDPYLNHDNYNLDESALLALKKMSSPRHNWAVLHLMSWIYCGFVVGSSVLAKRWDYRMMLALFVLTVVAFSFGFAQVGRRGHGEVTSSHSIAIARPASQGEWDVLQWNNVFVTSGDIYRLSHDGTGGLYSTAQDIERINGEIDCGLEGSFEVDIPPFSSRSFVARAKIEADPLDVTVESWKPEDGIRSLVLRVGEHFPAEAREMYVVAGREYAPLTRKEDVLTVNRSGSFSHLVRLSALPDQHLMTPAFFRSSDERPISRDEYFDSLLPAVIARSFGIRTQYAADTFQLPDDRIRLLVFAGMPERFFVNSQLESERDGRVLYAVDLLVPETP